MTTSTKPTGPMRGLTLGATGIPSSPPARTAPGPTRTKRDRIIYWTTTGIVSAVMLWSAYYFTFNEEMKGAFTHLGLPGYFRIELTVAKALGALALLIPAVPGKIKEFAYAGFVITILSASVAHAASGDGMLRAMEPLVFLGMLSVSYVYYQRGRIQSMKHGR